MIVTLIDLESCTVLFQLQTWFGGCHVIKARRGSNHPSSHWISSSLVTMRYIYDELETFQVHFCCFIDSCFWQVTLVDDWFLYYSLYWFFFLGVSSCKSWKNHPISSIFPTKSIRPSSWPSFGTVWRSPKTPKNQANGRWDRKVTPKDNAGAGMWSRDWSCCEGSSTWPQEPDMMFINMVWVERNPACERNNTWNWNRIHGIGIVIVLMVQVSGDHQGKDPQCSEG